MRDFVPTLPLSQLLVAPSQCYPVEVLLRLLPHADELFSYLSHYHSADGWYDTAMPHWLRIFSVSVGQRC